MTKLKKLKLRYYGMIALALALGVAGFKGVSAYQSEKAQNIAEAGGTIVVNNNYEAPQASEDPFLGAVSGPNLPNPNNTNNLDVYVASGSFIDASTTIFSVPSPFLKVTSTGTGSEKIVKTEGGVSWTSQTTTVDLANLQITGVATTSFRLDCGASPGPTPLAGVLSVRNLVTTTAHIPTSSVGVIENNLTAGTLISGGTVAKITLGSDLPYFVCVVSATDSLGFTNADNTFAGKIKVRFINNSR